MYLLIGEARTVSRGLCRIEMRCWSWYLVGVRLGATTVKEVAQTTPCGGGLNETVSARYLRTILHRQSNRPIFKKHLLCQCDGDFVKTL